MSEENVEPNKVEETITVTNLPEVEAVVQSETSTEQVVSEENVEPNKVEETLKVDYYFEGAKVEEIQVVLPDGTKLCRMSDGTSKHVPAVIFN